MVKHMAPLGEDDDSEAEEAVHALSPDPAPTSPSHDDLEHCTRPATMESRLKPTLALPYHDRPRSSTTQKKGLGITNQTKSHHHHFRFLQRNDSAFSSARPPRSRPISRKTSSDSLHMPPPPPPAPPQRSMTSMSDVSSLASKPRRSGLSRNSSRSGKEKATDDLSQMMSRASNYMTLAQVKINSVVLCLSYKGKGERNIEDVHDLVFRMPVLEYRNKTWSNLDLALRLKKDVIKALLSHTGTIIGNKLAYHRPTKQQTSRLRELVNSSMVLSNTDYLPNPTGDSGFGLFNRTVTQTQRQPSPSPRPSFASSGEPSPLVRHASYASSLHSSAASSTGTQGPSHGTSPDMTTHEQPSNGFSVRPLLRHVTSDTLHVRVRKDDDASAEDTEERDRKKSVLLLGKKILGSLERRA